MIKVALKGLLGPQAARDADRVRDRPRRRHDQRSFILTDTLSQSFDGIYSDSYKATDAVISSKVAIKTDDGGNEAPAFSAAVLNKVESLPGVESAQGSIEDEARLVDASAARRSARQATARHRDRPAGDQSLNPLQLVTGAWPRGDHQIAIDKSTAHKQQLRGRRRRRRVRERAARALPHQRNRPLRHGGLARQPVDLRLRSRNRAGAVRQARQARPDPRRREGWRVGCGARPARSVRCCPRRRR